MNTTLNKVIMFTAGAAIGSLVTWKVLEQRLKTKYERIAQNEIDSVIDRFSNRSVEKEEPDQEEDSEQIEMEFTEEEKAQYRDYTMQYGHINETDDLDIKYEPYVISPEEFGTKEGYDEVNLTYYADKVLTDEWDNVIEQVEDLVGADSLETVGQYEDDAVHVRNDGLMTDYEIIFDTRTFEDVKHQRPSTIGGK